MARKLYMVWSAQRACIAEAINVAEAIEAYWGFASYEGLPLGEHPPTHAALIPDRWYKKYKDPKHLMAQFPTPGFNHVA
jgi:hypothetical protein